MFKNNKCLRNRKVCVTYYIMQIKDFRFFSAELVTETLLLNIIGKELST